MKEATINQLPRRRGVVMRADGIEDSYGTKYVRDEGTGQLHRVSAKQRQRPKMFDLDLALKSIDSFIEVSKLHETENNLPSEA